MCRARSALRHLEIPAAALSAWHCNLFAQQRRWDALRDRMRRHTAVWAQVSCCQTPKASARACRYWAAVMRCRRGRK